MSNDIIKDQSLVAIIVSGVAFLIVFVPSYVWPLILGLIGFIFGLVNFLSRKRGMDVIALIAMVLGALVILACLLQEFVL